MLDHIILLIADLEGFKSGFETKTGVARRLSYGFGMGRTGTGMR